jgi:hypothetical protein
VTLFRHLVQTETVGSIDGEVSEGENEPPAPAGKAAQYQKLSNENVGLGRESKTLKTAPRLPEQGQSRETQDLQVRRDDLAKAMQTMAANANGDQKAMQQPYASLESSLALAKHAEEWTWKEEPSKV